MMGRGPGESIRGTASVVTSLLAEWRMENVDEGMGNDSSPEFHGTLRMVSMGGSGFAHPHFRMVAEMVGASAVHRDRRSLGSWMVFPAQAARSFASWGFELDRFHTMVLLEDFRLQNLGSVGT